MGQTKKLLFKLLLLSLPALIWVAWQIHLPLGQYTFRLWEALDISNTHIGVFAPNLNVSMSEVGDLAPYTKNAVIKNVRWETDSAGFRNTKPVCDEPYGIIIGDSMAVGSSLTQEDTVSEQMSRKFNRCFRAFTGGYLDDTLQSISELNVQAPIVVMVLTERSAGFVTAPKDESFKPKKNFFDFLKHNRLAQHWDYFKKYVYWNYRASHGVVQAIKTSFLSPDARAQLIAPRLPSDPQPEMTFMSNHGSSELLTSEQIQNSVNELNHFADQLQQRGSKLLVTFVPNKETIYDKGAHPKFNDRFKEKLKDARFIYVDLISRLQEGHRRNGTLYHHLDDSHWNREGVAEFVNATTVFLQPRPSK